MDYENLSDRAQGHSSDKPIGMDTPFSQDSADGPFISSAQERMLHDGSASSGVSAERTPTNRVRLSGAGQKRLKALVAKGKPVKTARSLGAKQSSASDTSQTTRKTCGSTSIPISANWRSNLVRWANL